MMTNKRKTDDGRSRRGKQALFFAGAALSVAAAIVSFRLGYLGYPIGGDGASVWSVVMVAIVAGFGLLLMVCGAAPRQHAGKRASPFSAADTVPPAPNPGDAADMMRPNQAPPAAEREDAMPPPRPRAGITTRLPVGQTQGRQRFIVTEETMFIHTDIIIYPHER